MMDDSQAKFPQERRWRDGEVEVGGGAHMIEDDDVLPQQKEEGGDHELGADGLLLQQKETGHVVAAVQGTDTDCPAVLLLKWQADHAVGGASHVTHDCHRRPLLVVLQVRHVMMA